MPNDQTNPAAPVSPAGWRVTEVFYDGRKPQVITIGKSYSSCVALARSFVGSVVNNGVSEMVVQPAEGWSALGDDALIGILATFQRGTMSVEMAASQIRAYFEQDVTETGEMHHEVTNPETRDHRQESSEGEQRRPAFARTTLVQSREVGSRGV